MEEIFLAAVTVHSLHGTLLMRGMHLIPVPVIILVDVRQIYTKGDTLRPQTYL
jgi:hypothetical protein